MLNSLKIIHVLKLKRIYLLFLYLWDQGYVNKVRIVVTITLMLLTTGLNVLVPVVFMHAVNYVKNHSNSISTTGICLILGYSVIWCLSEICLKSREIIAYKVIENGVSKICLKFYNQLIQLPEGEEKNIGEISNLLERIQNSVPLTFWGFFFLIAPTFLEFFLALLVIGYFFGATSMIILTIMMLVFILFNIYSIKKYNTLQNIGNSKWKAASTYAIDRLLNTETIKLCKGHQIENNNYFKKLRERKDAIVKQLVIKDLIMIGQLIIIGFSFTGIMLLVAFSSAYDKLGVGNFVLVNGYMIQFIAPLTSLGMIFQQLLHGLSDLEDVETIMMKNEAHIKRHTTQEYVYNNGNISFHDVSFHYSPEKQILKKVSFTIQEGETIAIVGQTGSGKSTIIKLLLKYYQPTGGSIQIDHQNLADLNSESLYQFIGCVPQNISLFDDTIRYNICYGSNNCNEDKMQRAIFIAGLQEFIQSLPNRLDTKVGERGMKLSGGERQRIAIARVILHAPKIFIFDEATSTLDLKTEQFILNNINKHYPKSTKIIVTHRLPSIINADHILVVHHGEVVERGQHNELLKNNNAYAALWGKTRSLVFENDKGINEWN